MYGANPKSPWHYRDFEAILPLLERKNHQETLTSENTDPSIRRHSEKTGGDGYNSHHKISAIWGTLGEDTPTYFMGINLAIVNITPIVCQGTACGVSSHREIRNTATVERDNSNTRHHLGRLT